MQSEAQPLAAVPASPSEQVAPAPAPAATPTPVATQAPAAAPSSPSATPATAVPAIPTADAQVTLVEFGGAQAPGHKRAASSGVVVRVELRSAGRVQLRADDATAILANGRRVPAVLGFMIESKSPAKVVMLKDTTVEGMSIDVKDKHYEAYSSMARMAAHLGGGAGWAYDAEPGNVLTLGAVFDCPSSQVRELDVLGSRLDVRSATSHKPTAGEATRDPAAAPSKILAVKEQSTLKVRHGKRPPFSEGKEPAPAGKRWLKLNVELATTDPKFKLLIQDIVLSDSQGHGMHAAWLGDIADGAALSSVDEVTRESLSVFVDNQGNVLYVIYPADDGVTVGFPEWDAAHQAFVASPPKIRLALAFAVPRAKNAYKLKIGNAAQVTVPASK
jgi:hypothetical protein